MGIEHWVECKSSDLIQMRNGFAFKSKDKKNKAMFQS